jgi:hypothetical protein
MVLHEEVYVRKSIARNTGYFTDEELDARALRLKFDDNTFEDVIKVRYDEFCDPSASPGYDKNKGHKTPQKHGALRRVRDTRHTLMPADKAWMFVDLDGYVYTWCQTGFDGDGNFCKVAHFRLAKGGQRLWTRTGGREISVEHEQAIERLEEMLKAGPVVVTTPCAAAGCEGVSRQLDFSDPRYTFDRKYPLHMVVDGVEHLFWPDLTVLDNGSAVYFFEIEKTHANEKLKMKGFAAHYPLQNAQFVAKEITVMWNRWSKNPKKVGVELLHSDRGRRFSATQSCVTCRNRVEAAREHDAAKARAQKDGMVATLTKVMQNLSNALSEEKASVELDKLVDECKTALLMSMGSLGPEQEKYGMMVRELRSLVSRVKQFEAAQNAVADAEDDAASKVDAACDTASFNAAKKACDVYQCCIRRIDDVCAENKDERLWMYAISAIVLEAKASERCRELVQSLATLRAAFGQKEHREQKRAGEVRASALIKLYEKEDVVGFHRALNMWLDETNRDDNALLASITTEGTKRTLQEVIEEHRSEQEYKASIFACSCADPENDTYAYISDDVEYSREMCGSEWVYS